MRWLPLWLLPSLVWGAQFSLVYTFPRTYAPPPAAFLITYLGTETQQLAQMSTPPSAEGACPEAGADTYCTAWPTCPPPGIMVFWVQAMWSDTDMSDRSDPVLLCLFTVEAPCVCQDPATYTPPPGAPVVVPPLGPGEIPPITTITLPPLPPFAPVFPPAPT